MTASQETSKTHSNDHESDDTITIDVRALINIFWRARWLIALCATIGLALGFIFASKIEPRYRATAKLLIGTQQADVLKGDGIMIESRFGDTTLPTHAEILRSTKLLGRVIDTLNLAEHPEFQPKPPAPPGLLKRAQNWLTSRIVLPEQVNEQLMEFGLRRAPAEPLPETVLAQRRRKQLVDWVESGISLGDVPDSRVITVSYTSGSPQLSAQIANAITEQYLVDQLEGKLEATRNAVTWLGGQVSDLQVRVAEAESAVETAKAELASQSGQSLEATQQQLKTLTNAHTRLNSEIAAKEAQVRRLSEAVAERRDLGALTEFRSSPIITNFRKTESELITRIASLEGTVSEGHPTLTRIREQLEQVRAQIRVEATQILDAITLDLEAMRSTQQSMVAQIRGLEEKAADQAQTSLQIRQLEREAEASRILYQNLLSRLQESSAEESLQTVDARVLSAAEPPVSAINALATRYKAVGLFGGLMLGAGIALLLNTLNNTFRSPQQLEQLSGQPVLGTIPQVSGTRKRADIVHNFRNKPNSAMAESIRNLRTSILYSNVDNPPRVIMFTSSVPKEGKSTTSTLVALTSRQMGKSAIIVDCDLRKPALAKVADVKSQEKGLLSVIEGTATVDEVVYKEPASGLHMLMTRPLEQNINLNAADILSSQRFRSLIEELTKIYDLVILDTPPTLVVTDARIVSQIADAVVFAVRWDRTPRAAVLEGIRELTSIGAPLIGVSMTFLNEAKAGKYSYDGYSYYKGQYRDYYDS